MLEEIIQRFLPGERIAEIKPYGNGHINTTYRVVLPGRDDSYILQRINTEVFSDPWGIAETHLKIQEIINRQDSPIKTALLIPTTDGKSLYVDKNGGVWRLTSFIENSYTVEVVEEEWQAFEAGNAFGRFARLCDGLDVSSFIEPVKDFHRLSFRIRQLDEAIERNRAGRLEGVVEIVDFFKDREKKAGIIEKISGEGKIPTRIVHNDTKINNLLFRGNRAVAVIDLDTAGPGIICYDYGDAVRTIANTAAEDEQDSDRIGFSFPAFTAFTRGYMGQVKPVLNGYEKRYLYLAPILMTYIMGIRFLADYLNGDLYYKTLYDKHNLVRSTVQKKLIERMEEKEYEIIDFLSGIFR